MNTEIHQPRLKALIQQRMASGHFQSIEDLLLESLETAPAAKNPHPDRATKRNPDEFLRQSPLRASGLMAERQKDNPRPVQL
jgi:hypothetical protein